MINQPRWKKPQYSKKEINSAGDIIKKENFNAEEHENALKIIDNWRASHAFPLQVIYVKLKGMTNGKDGIIVAQRLKRLSSIIDKLRRFPEMNLWRMQDLGGCRVIVNNVEEVYQYSNQYRHSRIRHIFKKENDYIKNPKPSGYRGIHHVYQYKSDSRDDYNNNILIEIQYRTHLQHLWATSVETMGLFMNQAIKSGRGSDEVNRFFALISSLFAIKENMPTVPNTPTDIDEIVHEIESINANSNYLDFLSSIKVLNKLEEDTPKNKYAYCVLSLDYEKNHLEIKRFKPSEIEQANMYYNNLENNNENGNCDTVLVRASSFSELRKAYPNYFNDISEFISIIKKYLN